MDSGGDAGDHSDSACHDAGRVGGEFRLRAADHAGFRQRQHRFSGGGIDRPVAVHTGGRAGGAVYGFADRDREWRRDMDHCAAEPRQHYGCGGLHGAGDDCESGAAVGDDYGDEPGGFGAIGQRWRTSARAWLFRFV